MSSTVDSHTGYALVEVVQKTWGHSAIRPLQRQAMDALLAGRDTLLILSTGGGKSLCYQAPALLMRGTAIVLSPLIALMKDQVDSLRQAGVRAACIHSASPPSDRMEARKLAESGELQLLYIAPERLGSENFLDWLSDSVPVSLLAVDEAHCISTWGHDFRPEYRQISVLRHRLGRVPVLACTATATPVVADDIAHQLQLREPVRLTGSFDRPNFTYRVLPQKDSERRIRAIIQRFPGQAGIIYCLSRKKTEILADSLVAAGIRALPYHAGLDDNIRHENHEAFLSGSCDVMVATVAFGMGIDKPDIRFVIHVGIPESLENYQQESGRAGRDGQPAECTLLFSYGDVILWRKRAQEVPSPLKEIMAKRLAAMVQYVESDRCRRRTLLEHFGESHPGGCGLCDRCRPDMSGDQELESVNTKVRSRRQTQAIPRVVPLTQIVSPADRIAERILSHFARTKQPTPILTAVDALSGQASPQVVESGHHQLTTFGLLSHRKPAEIWHWILQLQMTGNLHQIDDDPHQGPRLEITKNGWDTMTGNRTVILTEPEPQSTSTGIHHRSGNPTGQPDTNLIPIPQGSETEIFERLRQWRKLEAAAQKVSAFVVMGDSTLRGIAQAKPRSLEDLTQVTGIGQKRVERYGEAILEVLKMGSGTES